MKYLRHLFFGYFIFVLASTQALAQQEQLSFADSQKPADVRVIIDVSGSMKQNDPSNLRQPALELLIKLLPEGSKAGVWTFGKYINMLVPHRAVNDQWRADATEKAKQVNSVGLFTNIGDAIEKSAYDADSPSDQYKTSLILLTDGMVDIDKDPEKNQQEWRRIVDKVLPGIERSGYTIHTIALSDKADTALMDKLALGTDGLSEVAHTAEDLLKIFLRAFDQAAPVEQLPLTENKFLVDSSIEEFTALIFRSSDEPTKLISPDESEYRFDKEKSDVNWYKTNKYDLITIKQPLEGEWQVLADIEPDSRVSIISNLKLLVKPLPTNLFVDQITQLSLLLQDDKNTITDANFLGVIDVDSTVSNNQSKQEWPTKLSQAQPPANGIYATELNMFESEGSYNVSVLVDGKSFQRKFSHPITVREPFAINMEKMVVGGREKQRIKVRAHSQLVVPEQTQVVARIKDPKGRSAIKPLQVNASDEWELLLEPELEGLYQIRIRVSGKDSNDVEFNVDPEPLSFSYPSSDNPFDAMPVSEPPKPKPIVLAEPEVLVEEEPEVEVEPEPVVEPEPEPEAEVEPAVEEPEAEESNWLLYLGLGIGNILIIVLAFVAYKMILGKDDDGLAALEEELEDQGPDAKDKTKPEPEQSAAPEMEDIPEVSESSDDSIDLSSDEISDDDIPDLNEDQAVADEAEELLAGLQEPEEPEETDGFSLDDFSPDSLDDLISDSDDENKP